MVVVIGIAIGLAVGAGFAFLSLYAFAGSRLAAARRTRQLIISEAKREADALRREAQIEAREESIRVRSEVEQEVTERRAEIIKIEERVLAKEEEIDRKLTELSRREQGVADREVHTKQLQEELKEARDRELVELERISGMTVNEAKAHLLDRSEDLIRHELARRVRQAEEGARAEAKRRARNLVADALQRVAANHASETTVSLIELPSDDMKGRIIGREGRNIRALEHLTGVDVIIDDTPQAVVKTAKRAALLHDIGKALTHEVEGSHALLSAQYSRRYGETPAVVHAIEAHHYEVEPQTVEAVLVIAADAISASRPGARGESLEQYIKRLEALEEVAARHRGVEKVYALQAGREIRVIVKPKEVDDDGAVLLSHEIAREIEDQLEYPGQIKVTVIRESRAVDVARHVPGDASNPHHSRATGPRAETS